MKNYQLSYFCEFLILKRTNLISSGRRPRGLASKFTYPRRIFATTVRLDCNWTKENALVGTYDEDETSQTPSSSSDGCEDNGIDLENDSSDT